MTNQTQNPQTGATKQEQPERFNFTPQSLGIADSKEKDLVGIKLSPQEISESVKTMLMALSVPEKAIRNIRVSNKDGSLTIEATVEKSAVSDGGKQTAPVKDWIDFDLRPDNSRIRIKQHIYNALKNKAYLEHLDYRKLVIKSKDYVVFHFEAELLLSFLYDIPYNDMMYKCTPWSLTTILEQSEKYKDMYKHAKSKHDRKAIDVDISKKVNKIKEKQHYLPWGAILVWSGNKGGFHPNQTSEDEQ